MSEPFLLLIQKIAIDCVLWFSNVSYVQIPAKNNKKSQQKYRN